MATRHSLPSEGVFDWRDAQYFDRKFNFREESLVKTETQEIPVHPTSTGFDDASRLMRQHDCGPIPVAGTDDALYERHLVFDNVIELLAAGPRERFEAFARSVRDIMSQRWLQTEKAYARADPKRVYYLSMEFLISLDGVSDRPLARQQRDQ